MVPHSGRHDHKAVHYLLQIVQRLPRSRKRTTSILTSWRWHVLSTLHLLPNGRRFAMKPIDPNKEYLWEYKYPFDRRTSGWTSHRAPARFRVQYLTTTPRRFTHVMIMGKEVHLWHEQELGSLRYLIYRPRQEQTWTGDRNAILVVYTPKEIDQWNH